MARSVRKISRYAAPAEPEAEFQPGSQRRVLRNLFGITRKTEIDRVEYEALVAVQGNYLVSISPNTRFTAKLICRMHHDWLGRIYSWAGQYRNVELQKGAFRWEAITRRLVEPDR